MQKVLRRNALAVAIASALTMMLARSRVREEQHVHEGDQPVPDSSDKETARDDGEVA